MLSIVIPAYNRGELLREALKSLEIQTMKRFIVCVVDDCSTEDLHSIIKEFDDKLNIKYIRLQENRGPAKARQTGLDWCIENNIELVMFMDSDDMLMPNAVDRLTYEIQHTCSDIVSSKILAESSQGFTNSIQEANATWLHGKIYRVNFLKNRGIIFPPMMTNEDLGFNILALGVTEKKRALDEVLYFWRDAAGSITRTGEVANKIAADYIRAVSWAAEQLRLRGEERKIPVTIYYAIYNYYQQLLYHDAVPEDVEKIVKRMVTYGGNKGFYGYSKYKENMEVIKTGCLGKATVLLFKESFGCWLERFMRM